MEVPPISISQGAMGSLAAKLDARLDSKLKVGITKLRDWLVRLSKARDPPEIARIWMKDVREISYDMESYVDGAKSYLVDRMPEFKARVKEAKERYHRYKLQNIPIFADVFPIIDHRLQSVVAGGETYPVAVGPHVEGGALKKISTLLTDGDEQRKVLSIVGVGGIGKTTLAKQLWRMHKPGPGKYFISGAFVRTSLKPDMRRIFRSVLAQVRPDVHKPPEASDVHELIRDLREHLGKKRYLLIIDDLWAASVWDVARRAFPEGNGSRILTTTEVKDVALACCSNESKYIFDMQPLSLGDSEKLVTEGLDEKLKDEIIRSCGGLPLAITSICSVIASQWEANTIQNIEQIKRNFTTDTTPDDILKQVLNFCYNSLPSGLQTCLLYLSLYPGNYVILKEDIMKQWVSEGFILAATENDKMKVAGNYFVKLVDMGMIQQIDLDYSDEVLDYSDEVLYYAVHCTVHDLITSKSVEENFVTVIDYSQETLRLSNKVSRLSLQFGSAPYATAPASIGLSQVRSVAFIGLESCFPPISGFKLVRFLTLHMWADQPSTSVRLEHTSELVLLRSLQVTCNHTVHLPDLKQGLIYLETLEINARLAPIPLNIIQLRSWLHLRLGVGTELPDVTGTFKTATVYNAISLDESGIPPNTVMTINMLLPIKKIPKWVGHLTNLCVLKFVVRELQSDGIINLQVLPFLAVLSLRVQQPTGELISFTTGAFTALEYFGFRCGVLHLAFEKGAMPRLQRVKLGFNAHRGEKYHHFLEGIEDMLSIQKISVLIRTAEGAVETDLEAAEAACKKAVGPKHYSKTIIKRSVEFEEKVYPSEQEQHPSTPIEHPVHREKSRVNILDIENHSILGEYPSASTEQPRRQKQKYHEEFDPPSASIAQAPVPKTINQREKRLEASSEEPQRRQQDSRLSATTEQLAVPILMNKQDQRLATSSEQPRRQQQDSRPPASTEQPPVSKQDTREQHPSASSEPPLRREKESGTEIEQWPQEDTNQSISRMPPTSALSKNKIYSAPQQSTAILRKNKQTSKVEISMAGLELGLTKARMEGSLRKAQAAILVGGKLPQRARADMISIVDDFKMNRSFLNLLDEYIDNELVRTWVKKMHELAYSVDDCVDFATHLNKENWFFHQLFQLCAPVRITLRDQAVHEIKQLKGRMPDESSMTMCYNIISHAPSVTVMQHPAAVGHMSASKMLFEPASTAQILGGADLTELITNKVGHNLQVISIWGSGGDHGTASVIMRTYNDPEIGKKFTRRAWLKLVHPLSPQELIQRFMLQFCPAEKQEGADIGMDVPRMMQATQEDLFDVFQNIVTEERYLVVLEGMSNMEEWHAFRKVFPDRRKGSCIIVTTQQDEIASLCFGHSYQMLELKQFSADHSIFAIFKKGSDGDGDTGENTSLRKHYTDEFEIQVEDSSDAGRAFKIEASQNFSSNRDAATYWIKNYPLVGRGSEMNELRSYTFGARFSSTQVISVWGIAGIGKAALVRNLYYDIMLGTGQFNKYSWVDVSHPFNLRDFSRSLLSDFSSAKDPIKECRQLLKHHSCLVVIDDLQSKEEWDLIQSALVSRPSRSVIIIITNEASVAAYCTNNEDQVFNVKGLQADAAMDLFRNEVKMKNPLCPLYNHKDAELEELISKCGGIPKVIVSIAALLATQTVTLMDTIRSLNGKFMHHLETNPDYDSLRGLFDWMYNYFRTCPDTLKPCIFYLSIFPRGQNIRRRRIIRRWIAEGYSRDSEEESAVDKGENFFSKLLDLSIIQQKQQLFNTASVCQVNGFICEYIVSRRIEENLVFELGSNCVLTTQRTGHHLIILDSWDRDRIVFDSTDFSRLRSLTVFGKWESFFICKSMKMLQVLDLEDASGVKNEDLKKMVQQLHRLKFLSLRGCSEISQLPSSLGDLRQLQTLDVRHTSIATLPASITRLQELQYIRAGTTYPASTQPVSSSWMPEFRRHRSLVGVKVPRGIGKLTGLHTLGVVNVGASGGKAILKDLKKLTQLRKLGVSGINKHNSKEFLFATSGHVHLESLLVQLDKDSEDCLDYISLPWENLQSLKLYGLQDDLPLSSNPLSKLRKLDLEMDTLQRNDMEFLAKLPELCILHLRVKQQLQPADGELHFHVQMYGEELDTFKKVKILEVTCRSSRLHVIFGSKSMQNLELLKIDCSIASYQLTGLDGLSELKEVLIKGTDDEAIKADLESQLKEHPRKPIVKLATRGQYSANKYRKV